MKRARAYIVGAVLGVLALFVVPMAGVLPHHARSEFSAVSWYSWMAFRQSVTLRSLTVGVPDDLGAPDRAARAAGHYELVCATCHGSPAAPPAQIAADIMPPPPPLAAGARWRSDARLFQTIHQGLRNSAMPAWPSAARPDEVWDMVAFLQVLPGLDAATYRAAAGTAGDCRHCHGEAGEGRAGMPRLDRLSPGYIAASLRAYRDGTRASGTMIAVARRMDDDAMEAAARQFGRGVPLPLPAHDGSNAAALALRGNAAHDVPACLSCHEQGDPSVFPALLGQHETYLLRQLRLFSAEEPVRGGPNGEMMHEVARGLDEDDIKELAEWFSKQGETQP